MVPPVSSSSPSSSTLYYFDVFTAIVVVVFCCCCLFFHVTGVSACMSVLGTITHSMSLGNKVVSSDNLISSSSTSSG